MLTLRNICIDTPRDIAAFPRIVPLILKEVLLTKSNFERFQPGLRLVHDAKRSQAQRREWEHQRALQNLRSAVVRRLVSH